MSGTGHSGREWRIEAARTRKEARVKKPRYAPKEERKTEEAAIAIVEELSKQDEPME